MLITKTQYKLLLICVLIQFVWTKVFNALLDEYIPFPCIDLYRFYSRFYEYLRPSPPSDIDIPWRKI